MTDLIDTTEMYLRTVLDLEEEGIPPMRARIVERLDHSGPTVSQTVSRMERDGLLHVMPDRRIALTDLGRETAVKVMRKHRLAERLLSDVIGLSLEEVHDEACRWEHVMSEAVERRLVDLLHNPQVSPYGMPIPGLAGLSAETEEQAREALLQPIPASLGAQLRLADVVAAGETGPFTLVGLPEVVQTHPDLLSELGRHDILSGTRFLARPDGDGGILVRAASAAAEAVPADPAEADPTDEAHIPMSAATAIFVSKD